MAARFKNVVIATHHQTGQPTAYILWGLYDWLRGQHQKEILNPKLNSVYVIPKGQSATLFEVYEQHGYYAGILVAFIFRFSSDLELFFKDYLTAKIPNIDALPNSPKMSGNVFQRLDVVSDLFKVS